MKKILMHVCCASCFVAPYQELKNHYQIVALWFNPNIHPFAEYKNRLMSVRKYCAKEGIELIEKDDYGLGWYLKEHNMSSMDRCSLCYRDRFNFTAKAAKEKGYDFFTTSLLYSKFQMHDTIKEQCDLLAEKYEVEFYYNDFRNLWEEGKKLAKENHFYRQKYCGCIFSELERYESKKK